MLKKLIELTVEGAKIYDLCVEGDKLIEQGTGAVYNKPVKGVKVSKGTSRGPFPPSHIADLSNLHFLPSILPLFHRTYVPLGRTADRQASRSRRACP